MLRGQYRGHSLDHFLVSAEGSFLYSLLDVLHLEAHLGLISGQLLKGAAALRDPSFEIGAVIVAIWRVLVVGRVGNSRL